MKIKIKNYRAASPESVLIHLNPFALRTAKTGVFGCSECNRVNNNCSVIKNMSIKNYKFTWLYIRGYYLLGSTSESLTFE